MSEPDSAAPPVAGLRRSLGLANLLLYGLGTIIGAGIYVLVGEVAATAGMATPVAFFAAGGLAALTGLAYAELVARHPAAEGSVGFVQQAFHRPWLSRAVAAMVALVVVVAAASIALGGAGYLAHTIVDLPVPALASSVVALFTVIACLPVRASVRLAAAIGVIEIAGLVLVIAVGAFQAKGGPALAEMLPGNGGEWRGVAAGAFLAFFAFIGFESMANMAEETRDVGRTLPLAIVLAIICATLLYCGVALVYVLAVPVTEFDGGQAPLTRIVERSFPAFAIPFAAIAIAATLNGVLIEIVVLSRMAFGMARRRLLPAWLGKVHPRTATPVRATLVVGGVILVLTALVPFGALVRATSGLTLLVFAIVNLSLWQLQRRDPRPDLAVRLPRWLPPTGAAASIVLVAASFVL
ncbi:MAG: APC family permease [Proteobacteria bacterium]|nr:APC family permease [Pseudomonadota bacterium]